MFVRLASPSVVICAVSVRPCSAASHSAIAAEVAEALAVGVTERPCVALVGCPVQPATARHSTINAGICFTPCTLRRRAPDVNVLDGFPLRLCGCLARFARGDRFCSLSGDLED